MQVGATMELLRPLLADITADGLSLVGEVDGRRTRSDGRRCVLRGPLARESGPD